MSDPNLDYAAIRSKVEKGVQRQKWFYRIVFFAMHLLFFGVAMVGIWGTLLANEQLRDLLFNNQSGASLIVILPTIMWASVILFHLASLYIESGVAEKVIRERLLMREVGEDILRKGLEGLSEKPKRRTARLDIERVLSSDGELISDEDEPADQDDYQTRTRRAGSS
jgi:hypothetical protein